MVRCLQHFWGKVPVRKEEQAVSQPVFSLHAAMPSDPVLENPALFACNYFSNPALSLKASIQVHLPRRQAFSFFRKMFLQEKAQKRRISNQRAFFP